MEQMCEEAIIKFLKENSEPLPNQSYGIGYRAAIYLVDGTYLPCIIFRNSKIIVEHAIRRFKDEQTGKSIFKDAKHGYYDTVKTFVTKGNCVNAYDIAKVEKSKYAFPISTLYKIHGEALMSWTGFVAKMKDGKSFTFGTTFLTEFFDMPKGYSVDDIVEIINHSYISKTGEVKSYYADSFNPLGENPVDDNDIYRERPYFECYLDNL
ncbi:hypothetical protein [Papillibacter cinnamivorans]|uniref:Uncharacterized protein n=1 Tax=Papillibacter cinnamivorans DSM 12816 TaxID=1122930 RepID=A0A1W1YIK3_9FIRM|nr:hypothetical protein [Papillibacter cinnamivorans]SMC35973.1 hypothetical protein SAMN02745168_0449 [Papillibacter cinnamivorans DSM 12816]